MHGRVIQQIQALLEMPVSELRQEWERLYGEPTRSRNRDYLWRRLAWRVQELAHGGLSERAKAKIDELAPEGFTWAKTPRRAVPGDLGTVSPIAPARAPRCRDPRLPAPGTVLTRRYHGSEIRVHVLDDGFEWDGRRFGSLSALAREITGQRWNGLLFFGLTKRKRKS